MVHVSQCCPGDVPGGCLHAGDDHDHDDDDTCFSQYYRRYNGALRWWGGGRLGGPKDTNVLIVRPSPTCHVSVAEGARIISVIFSAFCLILKLTHGITLYMA